MARIGFHASHEQAAPSRLLRLARQAEASGFDGAMSSDHLQPWGPAQGESGYAWSWIGAALASTAFPIGLISAPGYRYHPAVVAQGAATLAEMFPGRFWLALGSGQRLNEAVTGLPWPEKAERTARLAECATVIRALLAGETVIHRGRVTVLEGRLWSRPATPPLLLGAAVTEATAEAVGAWADGLLTTGTEPEALGRVVEAFRRGGGEGKPLVLQLGLAWGRTEAEALAGAHLHWRYAALGGEVNWDLARPEDFDTATRHVRPEDMRASLLISADPAWHAARIAEFADMGFSEIHLHQCAPDQEGFVEAFGRDVLPSLRQS